MEKSMKKLIEGGTVTHMHDNCFCVEVDGVELYVGTTLKYTACTCCDDMAELEVGYNRPTDYRIEKHGSKDPLNILPP